MPKSVLPFLILAIGLAAGHDLPGPRGWQPFSMIPAALADDDDDDDGGDDDDDDGGSAGGDDDDDDGGRGDDAGPDGGPSGQADSGERNDDDRRGGQRESLLDWWSRVVGGQGQGSGRETVADEVLVVDIGIASLQQALGQGFTLIERRQLGTLNLNVTRLGLPPGLSPDAAASRFQATAPSGTVDVNHAYQLQAATCSGDYCWGPQLIGWRDEAGRCGSGLRIGMIDTAVDGTQPALRKSRIRGRSFVERSAADEHGTAIASLLVGSGGGLFGGLLPQAELLAADVFSSDSSGRPRAGALQIATALDWLAGQRVSVVNVSIAGPPNAVLELAIRRTVVRGIPIVAAAGNNGAEAAPAYPAAYPGVLAATAVDRDGEAYANANRGEYVAFAAPGVDLWTVNGNGVARGSGTSYAAAFLTGVVAQNIGRGGTTAAGLTATLSRRAQDLGAPGKDPVFGWGLVRAAGACRG